MLIYKNGVKNGVSTLLLFDKNGVPQHSLFDVKSENGVKNGVHTLFYMIARIFSPWYIGVWHSYGDISKIWLYICFTLTLHSEEKKSISEITSLVNCGVMGDKKLGCTLPCYDYEPFLFNFSTPSFFTPLLVSTLPSFYPYEIITMINKLASTFTSTKTVSR